MAGRPDRVRTIGPVARPARGLARQVQTFQDAQPSRGVRMPGRGVLRVPGQDARLGAIFGCARRQLLPQRERYDLHPNTYLECLQCLPYVDRLPTLPT